jgi:hypothetical protein
VIFFPSNGGFSLHLWGQSNSCLIVKPAIGVTTPERINWQLFELATTDNGWTGFAIPPILGTFVAVQGTPGYAFGFITFVILCLLSMGLAFNLIRSRQTMRKLRNAPTEQ